MPLNVKILNKKSLKTTPTTNKFHLLFLIPQTVTLDLKYLNRNNIKITPTTNKSHLSFLIPP